MKKEALRRCSLTLLGLAALTACTDSKYDLGDIDMTMHLGSGTLTLPASSTDSIYLGNLFDLAEDGPIKKVADPQNPGDSIYYLDVDGSANPADINIDDIVIKKPEHDPINAEIWLNDIQTKRQAIRKRERDNSQNVFHYSIRLNEQSLTAESTDPISLDVVDIKDIGFKLVEYTLQINLSTKSKDAPATQDENIDIIELLYLDNFVVNIPRGLEVRSCTYKGQQKDVGNAKETGIINLSETDTDGYNPKSGPLTLKLTIDGAEISETSDLFFNPDEHKAGLDGKIYLSGDVDLTLNNVDQQKLYDAYQKHLTETGDPQIVAKLAALIAGDYNPAIQTVLNPLYIFGPGEFDKDMTVTTFSGHLRHEVDEIEDITLDDLPDFLTDDDVTLDLSNPQVFLKIFTSIPTSITTDIQMIPYTKDENGREVAGSPISISDIEYDGTNGDTLLLCVAKNTAAIEWPNELSHLTYRDTRQVTNIGSLIEKVPDRIGIKGKNGSDKLVVELPECDDIVIGQPYSVAFSYKVSTPLTFGEGFKIVYQDEDTGWDIAEDVEDLHVSKLELTASAVSNVPLGIKLTATPLDANGNTVNGITISYKNEGESSYQTSGIYIPANANSTGISLRIEATDGSLSRLDGLKYRAELSEPANDSQMQALRTKSHVRLKDVHISIVDGITIKDND